VPNEVEAEMLSGVVVKTPEEAMKASQVILSRGVSHGVIVTMGSRGAVAVTATGNIHVPAFPVTPVDPTGAGDAFCGAFAAALSEGQTLPQALRFANAAGALSVTIAGAEPSLPKRNAIETLLARYP
jgi:ribokinase